MNSYRWLISRNIDLLVFHAPVWLIWIVLFLLPQTVLEKDIPLQIWVIFVLLLDVGHVWSSLFRTYLDPVDRQNHKTLLWAVPLASFLVLSAVSLFGQDMFWRVLAYLAVYHFIKQQFGFLQLYKARNKDFAKKWIADKFIIYWSTIMPVLYWHFSPGRNFEWFIQGDFVLIDLFGNNFHLFPWFSGVFFLAIFIWLFQEFRSDIIPWPKIFWVTGTALNWYLGIVYFNSDLAFTLTNVTAHGLPYLALVIYFSRKRNKTRADVRVAEWQIVGGMLGLVFFLAFAEEYFWDVFVYHDNEGFFGALLPYGSAPMSGYTYALIMALLAVPQVSHYIFDGYIWKSGSSNPDLKDILLK